MTKMQQILAMLDDGYSGVEVAKRFWVKPGTVNSYSWRARNPERWREVCRIQRQKRNGWTPLSERILAAEKRAAPIIVAVDAGKSYTQVAKEFGLQSRCVVAGIMHRRAESKGAGA